MSNDRAFLCCCKPTGQLVDGAMAFLSAAFSTLEEAWGESSLSLTTPPPTRMWRPPTAAPSATNKPRGSSRLQSAKSGSCDLYDQQMRQVRKPSDAAPPVRSTASPPTMTKRTPASFTGPTSAGVPAADSGFWNAGGGIAACAAPALLTDKAVAAAAADKALDKALYRETKAAKAAAVMQASGPITAGAADAVAKATIPAKAGGGGEDDPMGPYLDLVLFVASGVLLIFVLEQVLQLGIHIGRRQASFGRS